MNPLIPSWLKWGAALAAALTMALMGFQVASWRAGALEAVRLKAEKLALEGQIQAEAEKDRQAEQDRVDVSADVERTEAELQARIADLQEQVRANQNIPDCEIPEDVAGTLNKAMGHERK